MIEKCNFKNKVDSEDGHSKRYECSLGRVSAGYLCSGVYNIKCAGEDNCILFQLYKNQTQSMIK